jgi:dipeptidyl aminopeptidase/acylaminoacyl peptidase
LQGLEDKVVPPNQAEMMVELLQKKGIKVAHITFPDEGHGFRKAANIILAIESELAFYRDVFNLQEAR